MAFGAAVAIEQGEAPAPDDPLDVSIAAIWLDRAQKRAGFDVSTAEGIVHLAMYMPRPGRLHLEATLPSGRSYLAEIDPAELGLEREPGGDELAGHLRTAIAFVVRCFEREAHPEH